MGWLRRRAEGDALAEGLRAPDAAALLRVGLGTSRERVNNNPADVARPIGYMSPSYLQS